MKTINYSFGILGLMALVAACNSSEIPTSSSVQTSINSISHNSEGGGGSSSSCNISSMTKNGSNAADPSRSAYECHFDDDNSVLKLALYTDTGAYVQIDSGSLDFRRWKVDVQACVMTIYIHPAGADLYYITNITLNGNNTLKDGSFYNISNGTTRTFSNCYYDTSPGF